MSKPANSEQAEFWSRGGGLDWVTFDKQLDELFAEVNKALLEAVSPDAEDVILDVGCGTGATTREFATKAKFVDGIDISDSMIARAKQYPNPNTKFSLSDAQVDPIEAEKYDWLISRFGVMFFDDPIEAFKNLRTGLALEGKLAVACWGPFKQNPWFTIPRKIATDFLGSPPSHHPHAPGPFAFSDEIYTLEILKAAGFSEAKVETRDIWLALKGTAADAAKVSSYIGPADSVVRAMGGSDEDKAIIVSQTEKALAAYASDGLVKVPAKIHLYLAKK